MMDVFRANPQPALRLLRLSECIGVDGVKELSVVGGADHAVGRQGLSAWSVVQEVT